MTSSIVSTNYNPLVSVIIPVYNSEKYIADAIESVLCQTYKNFEILVVDDGSTDDTEKIVLYFKKLYNEKIRYFYQKNGGPAKARNLGIKNASGEHIAFLDSDDIWLPEKLAVQVAYYEENPYYGMVYSNLALIKNGNIFQATSQLKEKGWILYKLVKDKFIYTSTIIIKKNVLRAVGDYHEDYYMATGEDTDLYLRIANKYQIGYLDKVLVHKRIHDSNLGNNISPRCGTVEAITNFYRKFPEFSPQNDTKVKKALGFHNARKGYELFNANKKRNSRRFFITAIRYSPFNWKIYIYLLFTYCPSFLIKIIRKLKSVI